VSKGPRGVRLNPQQDERTRSAIQTTQIVKRLTKLVNGEVEMPPHAVTAALGLLRKTLPDLTSTELTGEVTTPGNGCSLENPDRAVRQGHRQLAQARRQDPAQLPG
jgi:hypothetical protein